MFGVPDSYVYQGEVFDWITDVDLGPNQVLHFGNVICVTRTAFEAGQRATGAIVGVFNFKTAAGLTATLGAEARFDAASQTLVASGGVPIGVYLDPVVAGDTQGTVRLVPGTSISD